MSFTTFIWCRMDFDSPAPVPVGGFPWDRLLAPVSPRVSGTMGLYAWSPTQLLIPGSEHTGAAQVTCDDSGFSVEVDVKHFSPEQLLVKVVGDYVVVEGKHEQRQDGAELVTRQFNRRYRIPSGVNITALDSVMSPEGTLIISAPLQDRDDSRLLTLSRA